MKTPRFNRRAHAALLAAIAAGSITLAGTSAQGANFPAPRRRHRRDRLRPGRHHGHVRAPTPMASRPRSASRNFPPPRSPPAPTTPRRCSTKPCPPAARLAATSASSANSAPPRKAPSSSPATASSSPSAVTMATCRTSAPTTAVPVTASTAAWPRRNRPILTSRALRRRSTSPPARLIPARCSTMSTTRTTRAASTAPTAPRSTSPARARARPTRAAST